MFSDVIYVLSSK